MPPALSGPRRTRGRYHFVDARVVHLFHYCIVWVLGFGFFYEDRLNVNSLFFGTNCNVLDLVNSFMVLMQH